MPFHNLSLKLVIVVVSLLAHHVLVVRCASLGVALNATTNVLSNPSASEVTQVQSATSDLLDERVLTFLADCKKDDVTEKICELYRSLAVVLSQQKRDPVKASDLNRVIAEQTDGDRFCTNLSPLLQAMRQKHPGWFAKSSLENRRVCENWCVPFDEDKLSMYVKPICKALLWGFHQELQYEVEDQNPIKQAAKAIMPPLLPIGSGPMLENDNVKLIQAQPAAAAQPNITLPENAVKADPSPKNTETNKSKVSSDKADVAPKNVFVGASGSQTTVANNPSKAVASEADKNLGEGDENQDINELRNQENLKDMNGNSPSNIAQDEGDTDDDTMYDTDAQVDEPQETPENVQPKLEEEPFGMKKTDSGATAEDQKPDSAVQVERVEQEDPFFDPDDSNFFSYFLFMMFVCILCYVAYHNKSKLLALVLEGRRTNSGRGGFNKGRKHTAAYRKLDSNLEEAITSNAAASSRSTSQIIY